MSAPGAVPAPNRWMGWGARDVVWAVVAIAGALLPVDATARWFNAPYNATHADLVAGVWIFKLTLVALAAAGLTLRRWSVDPVVAPHRNTFRGADATTFAALAALLVLALGLRVYRLDSELWLDEIQLLARYAPLEFRQLLSTYDSQNHQPLYSMLARLAYLAGGGSDWSVRLPAVLAGVASLAAMWWFGRRVTSTREAMLGALILAVSYHHVWFSQNARGYTAMMLLAVLATGAFLRLLEGDGRPSSVAWAYAILMALATYTHLTAALIAVGHAFTLLIVTRWNSREGRSQATWSVVALVLSALLTVCLYAPMLPQVWREITKPTMEGVAIEWTGAGWMLRETLSVLGDGIPGGLATVFGGLAVLCVGVASYWRQSRVAALLMFLPIAVTFAALVATRHNLWPRFFFFASGFLVLAALRGGFVLVRLVVRWRPEAVAVAGASAVALLSLLTVPRAWQPKQQFRAAHDFVERERLPGDAVVALEVASHVYLMRGWAPTWGFTTSLPMLLEAERSAARTWVVFTLPARLRAIHPELVQHLAAPRYQVVRIFPATVGGGEIHILRNDSATRHD